MTVMSGRTGASLRGGGDGRLPGTDGGDQPRLADGGDGLIRAGPDHAAARQSVARRVTQRGRELLGLGDIDGRGEGETVTEATGFCSGGGPVVPPPSPPQAQTARATATVQGEGGSIPTIGRGTLIRYSSVPGHWTAPTRVLGAPDKAGTQRLSRMEGAVARRDTVVRGKGHDRLSSVRLWSLVAVRPRLPLGKEDPRPCRTFVRRGNVRRPARPGKTR